MTTVLVTGAQGFIGRHLVVRLLSMPRVSSIVGLGRSPWRERSFTHAVTWRSRPLPAPLPAGLEISGSRFRYLRIDLENSDDVSGLLSNVRPDIVVHLAAALRDEPTMRLFTVNAAAVAALLEAAGRARPRPRVLLCSSGSVYGTVDDSFLPLQEDGPCQPFDTYSISKQAGEVIAAALAARLDVPLTIARIFNVIGPGLDERHLPARLASQLAPIILGLSPPRITLAPLKTTRDFVDVRDVADGLALLAFTEISQRTVNVASGRETSVALVADTMIDLAGLTGRITIRAKPGRMADMSRNVASIERLTAYGYRPRIELTTSLQDLLDYYCHEVAEAASELST